MEQLHRHQLPDPEGLHADPGAPGEGVFVDLYNLHPNADDTDDALAARRANIAQVSAFIKANSAGNAVIVMGDTNTRYTRAGDNIRTLVDDNGLTDAWVKLVKGGTAPTQGADPLLCPTSAPTNDCEVVDKVLYRGSNLVNLTATRYNDEWAKFLDSSGGNLSDHFPHTVDFSYTLNTKLRASDFLGGRTARPSTTPTTSRPPSPPHAHPARRRPPGRGLPHPRRRHGPRPRRHGRYGDLPDPGLR